VALSRLVLVALAAGLLNWAVPAAQASSLGDGDAAFDAGRYGDAAKAWSAAASAGDAEAAFNLGLLYDLGNGVPESAGTAFYWYTRAADGGLGVAAFNVGVMYDSGRGVPVDRTEAGIWYARAAVLGQARAAFNLGQLYEYGEGVPQNYAAARAWYALAGAAIPEAALKASALAARHSTAMAGPLVPPTPVWPTSGGVVALSGPHPGVQLVWTAPAEPQPVTFFVELQARENGHFNEVTSSYVETSAIAITLPDDTDFAWRVYAVAADGSGYASSAWMRFDTAVTLPPGIPPRAAHS
jgi:TPR repeat protein